MNLILLDPSELAPDGAVRLTGPRADHLITVLRAAPGQHVRVGVLNGGMGQGIVASVGRDRVDLQCTFEDQPPLRSAVDLLIALPRPKVMRRLWAQIAAVGADRIILTNAARVERDYFDTHILSPETYAPLLIEGLQQARDTRVPVVSIHRQFRVLVEDHLDELCPHALRLVAQPGELPSLAATVRHRASDRVLVAIGPEGGWNDFELTMLEAHRFVGVAMGPRTLRSDTACLAILSIVHEALRERPRT